MFPTTTARSLLGVEDLDAQLDQLESLLGHVETFEPEVREDVFLLLDGIDAIHRMAISRFAAGLDDGQLSTLRDSDPAVAWLLEAYGIGIDESAAAEAALATIRPYVEGHGGHVDLLQATQGVVTVRLSGACAGCTSSAETARAGVEKALRDGVPGFRSLLVEQDEAPAHPPPGPTLGQAQTATLLQIQSRPPQGFH